MNPDEEYHEPPEACYIIEGEWANDDEDTDERTLGRKIQTENS